MTEATVDALQSVVQIAAAVLTILGVVTSVWSLISTRNRFYKDYLRRKRGD